MPANHSTLAAAATVQSDTAQPVLDWGAHRVAVTLEATARPSTVPRSNFPSLALVELYWRRRDVRPEAKDVLVAFRPAGQTNDTVAVSNRVVLAINGSVARVLLDASHGAGRYELYYLPYISNGASFGRKDSYVAMRRNGSSTQAWLEAVCGAGWKLDEAEGENSPRFVAAQTSLKLSGSPRYEAQTPHDLFTSMEVAATPAELAALYNQYAKGQPALLIPYDNQHVVRSFAFVSTQYLWYEAEKPVWALPSPIKLHAAPNQYLVWQLAVVEIFHSRRWANISNIRVDHGPLTSAERGESIPAANLSCFNIDGVDQMGKPFTLKPHINVSLGSILPLWFGVDLGMAVSGTYEGSVTVTADVDGKPNAWSSSQRYSIAVAAPALLDRGDHNASLLSRVRWLNSRFGLDNDESTNFDLPEPFTPIQRHLDTLKLFGKTVAVGNAGLPAAISVVSPPYAPRDVLQAPMSISINGGGLATGNSQLNFTKTTAAKAAWTSHFSLPDQKVAVQVNGSAQFDGYTEFTVQVEPTAAVAGGGPTGEEINVSISIPLTKTACRWMMKGGGTGVPIGNATSFEYRWSAGKPNNMFWLGSVQAGVRLRLRGPQFSWRQPRGPYHYADLPPTNSSLPKFWHNGGKGGVRLRVGAATAAESSSSSSSSSSSDCVLEAFTGPLRLKVGDPALLHFDVLVTPNKPAQSAVHFQKQRYYQIEAQIVPPETLLSDGINIANVHQGNDYNPWIIYPLDPVANAAAKSFAERMHRGNSKVKSYYSSGSLSFVTPELWAFFAMYGELMSHPAYVDPIPPPTPPPTGSELETSATLWGSIEDNGPTEDLVTTFGPHHWFSEHAATALFSSDWTTPLSKPTESPICEGCDMDVSFTTRANSRLANFWSRLLVLATEELDIDGIYLG
eukprot:COSAG02_NODE_512_length_20850_cov_4.993302_15_plen_904_part_00